MDILMLRIFIISCCLFPVNELIGQIDTTDTVVRIKLKVNERVNLKLYYIDSEDAPNYGENRTAGGRAYPSDEFQVVEFKLGNREIHRMRFDIENRHSARLIIAEISITKGNNIQVWQPIDIYYDFYLNRIDLISLTREGFEIQSQGQSADPFVIIREDIKYTAHPKRDVMTKLELSVKYKEDDRIRIDFADSPEESFNSVQSIQKRASASGSLTPFQFNLFASEKVRHLRMVLGYTAQNLIELKELKLSAGPDTLILVGSEILTVFQPSVEVEIIKQDPEIVSFRIYPTMQLGAFLQNKTMIIYPHEKFIHYRNSAIAFVVSIILLIPFNYKLIARIETWVAHV